MAVNLRRDLILLPKVRDILKVYLLEKKLF